MIYKDDFMSIIQNVMFNGASADWNNIIFRLDVLKEDIDSEIFPHTSEWVDILITHAKMAKRKNCSYDNMINSIMAFAFFYYNMANIMGLDEDDSDEIEPCVEEIIENALESAMDDGNEYYDDKICQIGDLYVSYTSPCDEFPNGCVLVVDSEGRMYGNWCDVSDSGFAVDFLVETIEKCENEFNRVV